MARSDHPILILGSNGMLARSLSTALSARGLRHVRLSRSECDITDPAQVQRAVDRFQPFLLFNCAAHTRVDDCEQQVAEADAVNGTAVGFLAHVAKAAQLKLVHFSTDAVFDGVQRTPYSPTDAPAPISAYGRSKLSGEQLVRHVDPQGWLIIRTAWLFGDGHCFPRTILFRAADGRPLRVVNDQTGSPTSATDLADAAVELALRGAHGIWHVTNAGTATWFDVAEAVLHAAAIKADLRPVTTEQYRRIHPKQALRPTYSVLNIEPVERVLGRPMRHWRDALSAYVASEVLTRSTLTPGANCTCT